MEFHGGFSHGMLVKYANFVKIQSIAPDKIRVRPKASNLLVVLVKPLSLK